MAATAELGALGVQIMGPVFVDESQEQAPSPLGVAVMFRAGAEAGSATPLMPEIWALPQTETINWYVYQLIGLLDTKHVLSLDTCSISLVVLLCFLFYLLFYICKWCMLFLVCVVVRLTWMFLPCWPGSLH